MPVRPGEAWGSDGVLPPDGVVVRTDAEARAVVEGARRDGREIPALGLLGGDLCRTLGGTGDERRLREGGVLAEVDLGAVLVDGRLHWFVAHLVARRGWLRGPIVAVMNAQFLGEWDVAPRAHPGDGKLDLLVGVHGGGGPAPGPDAGSAPAPTCPTPASRSPRSPPPSSSSSGRPRVRLDGEVVADGPRPCVDPLVETDADPASSDPVRSSRCGRGSSTSSPARTAGASWRGRRSGPTTSRSGWWPAR